MEIYSKPIGKRLIFAENVAAEDLVLLKFVLIPILQNRH